MTSFASSKESIDVSIHLGLCCINNSLRDKDIFCSRTCIRRTYTPERAQELAEQNLLDLHTILKWNTKNNIKHYRLSSDMFPRFTDDEVEKYDFNQFKPLLKMCGDYAKKTRQRITMHPGQYNQVGAKSQKVFDKTVEDLSHHCDILDAMGCDEESILTVHGGGVYGDKESAIRRWKEQFDDLPTGVKKRLTIENCELQYNVEDCIDIADDCKIPVILDTHHFDCYNKAHETEYEIDDYMDQIVETWKDRKMVTHVSEQKENSRLGAHHDYVEVLPECLISIPEKYRRGVDIEVEAKAKEKAIFKLYNKYSNLF
jgi:UV DNA damage endonuclease